MSVLDLRLADCSNELQLDKIETIKMIYIFFISKWLFCSVDFQIIFGNI